MGKFRKAAALAALAAASWAACAGSGLDEPATGAPQAEQASGPKIFSSKEQRAFWATVKIESRSKATGLRRWSGSGYFAEGHPGLLVTNNHVATDAALHAEDTELVALDASGKEMATRVAHFDIGRDIAILELKEPAQGHAALKLAAALPELGEEAVCAGFPLGQPFSLIPARFVKRLENKAFRNLMLSASTDGGVSGGPTLNSAGEAIGANVAGAGRGVAYSVPVEVVKAALAAAEEKIGSKKEFWRLSEEGRREEILRQIDAVNASYAELFFGSGQRKVALGEWTASVPTDASVNCGSAGSEREEKLEHGVGAIGFVCRLDTAGLSLGESHLGNWRLERGVVLRKLASAARFAGRAASSGEAFSFMHLGGGDPYSKRNRACSVKAIVEDGMPGEATLCQTKLGEEPRLRGVYARKILWGKESVLEEVFSMGGVEEKAAKAIVMKFMELSGKKIGAEPKRDEGEGK